MKSTTDIKIKWMAYDAQMCLCESLQIIDIILTKNYLTFQNIIEEETELILKSNYKIYI